MWGGGLFEKNRFVRYKNQINKVGKKSRCIWTLIRRIVVMSYKKVYLINLGLSSDYKKSKIIRNLIEKDFKNNSYKYRCDFQQIYDNHYGIIQIPSNAFECHLNELKNIVLTTKLTWIQ